MVAVLSWQVMCVCLRPLVRMPIRKADHIMAVAIITGSAICDQVCQWKVWKRQRRQEKSLNNITILQTISHTHQVQMSHVIVTLWFNMLNITLTCVHSRLFAMEKCGSKRATAISFHAWLRCKMNTWCESVVVYVALTYKPRSGINLEAVNVSRLMGNCI